MADEKHSRWLGSRLYIAVTAGMGCILGVALATSADAESLEAAYGEFQQEVLATHPDYQPESVNTDGWSATQTAWQRLFPGITVVLCFLHSVLAITQRCRRFRDLLHLLSDKLWHLYHSDNARQFSQRLRRLCEWAHREPSLPETVREKLLGLKAKAPQFMAAFKQPGAARTSNQVARLMNVQDRLLYAMQYFHGTLTSAKQALRAMALLWNFHPYTRKTQALAPHSQSPFEDLNGFRYHDNWLRNLLIAASLNGRNTALSNKHKLG